MLMQHPFTFRLGGANITLITNDETTRLTFHHAGISEQCCDGKFIAIGVDLFDTVTPIVITLLTTVGEREYNAYVLEISDEGHLERNSVIFTTEKDLTYEGITILYSSDLREVMITSPDTSETVYKHLTIPTSSEQ